MLHIAPPFFHFPALITTNDHRHEWFKFLPVMSEKSVKSAQHALKSTEELPLAATSFELRLVVTHQTKAGRGSLNLQAPFQPAVTFFQRRNAFQYDRMLTMKTNLPPLWPPQKDLTFSGAEQRNGQVWTRNFPIICVRWHTFTYFSKTFRDKDTTTPDTPSLAFHMGVTFWIYLKY